MSRLVEIVSRASDASVDLVGAAIASNPFVGVVNVTEPGRKFTTWVFASLNQEPGCVTCGPGVETLFAALNDDHVAGVNDDPPHMTGEGRPEDVVSVDRNTGVGLATSIDERFGVGSQFVAEVVGASETRERVNWAAVEVGRRREARVVDDLGEGAGVDHDVQRHCSRFGGPFGCSCRPKDSNQGVVPALRRVALQVEQRGIGTVLVGSCLHVGFKLGVAELLENRDDLGGLQRVSA